MISRPTLSLLALLLVSVPAPSPASPAATAVPRGPLPETVIPRHYSLDLTIDPRQERFSGVTDIDVDITRATATIWLHGLGLEVVQATVEINGRSIPARYSEVEPVTGVARLELESPVAEGRARLHFAHSAAYREGAEGLFLARVGDDRYVFSQLQAIDARRVFPGFDEPRFKTPFDVTVRAVQGDEVIANAPLLSQSDDAEGLVAHRFQTTLPLPTYLLAFAVGPLDVVEAPPVRPNAVREKPLPLRAVATRGQGPKLAFALANTPAMVEQLELYFGIPFPYQKLDILSSPQMTGAMENAGAILYDDNLLLLGTNPTPVQQRSFAEVHAHELAHQWFGDLVTPVWWDDIWLNESFAEWMGARIAAAWAPGLGSAAGLTAAALETMTTDSKRAGRPIRQPVTDNTQIASTFDAITYLKGAGVLAMFESYLGEETFRRGVGLHLGRHRHGSATAEDFFAAMAEVSRQPPVIEAFRSFIEQPGVPLVSLRRAADDRKLELAQSRYRPLGSTIAEGQLWQIPFCVKLYDSNPPRKQCTLIADTAASMALPEAAEVLMPNADGAGYYRFALDEQSVDRLLAIAAGLPDGEALALADSVAAAFRAGRLPFAQFLSAARALAGHSNRQAATSLGYELASIQSQWFELPVRRAIAGELSAIYAPRLDALGLDLNAGAHASDPSDRRLLRRSLVAILALDAREVSIRSLLAEAAKSSLDDPAALDGEFRDIAWSVGAQDLGPAFFEAMRERLLSGEDASSRTDAATAIGAVETAESASAALALAIDPQVRVGEMFRIVWQQVNAAATRDAAWPWLAEHFDSLTNKLPGFAQSVLFELPSSYCDAAHRREIESLMTPAVVRTGKGSLELARTLETIDLCMAQKAVLGPRILATLALTR